MNLPYMYEVMAAVDEPHDGLIKLHGMQADRQMRLMASSGMVEATFDDGKEGSFSAIDHITATGQAFLRMFKKFPMPVLPVSEFSLGLS